MDSGKNLVPYKLAVRFKMLGITKWATKWPTISEAFRWFRKEQGSYVIIQPSINNDFSCIIWTSTSQKHIGVFKDYEEAELACLDKLIEIVETKSTQNTNDGRTMEKLIESNRKFDEKNNDNVKYDSSDRNEDTPNITNFFI